MTFALDTKDTKNPLTKAISFGSWYVSDADSATISGEILDATKV